MGLGTWIVLATSLHICFTCDPDFCVDRTVGQKYCDPANNASYYSCDHAGTQHFKCGVTLVYKDGNCGYAYNGACVPNPIPDVSLGTVVNGYCQYTGNTPSPVTDSWNVFTRNQIDQSSCSEIGTLDLQRHTACALYCLYSTDCSAFKYVRNPSTASASYTCQLLKCSVAPIASGPERYSAVYERITQ